MDDDERESNASSDNENEQDEIMEDADDGDNDNEVGGDAEVEEEENEDEEEDDGDGGGDANASQTKPGGASTADKSKQAAGKNGDASGDTQKRAGAGGGSAEADGAGAASAEGQGGAGSGGAGEAGSGTANSVRSGASATPAPDRQPWRPRINPALVQARLYDIVPTMAAPQATSINAFAATPDNRFWMTGGSDGYVRKYDGVGTINGKQLLTVAQRHPFVDSVVKAGILMSYWENEETAGTGGSVAQAGGSHHHGGRAQEEHTLSPVYSLAVHSQGLWLLSGTEGGSINLSSVRHDEGKRIACMTKHSSAVSVLQLLPDEKSVLSGSWDKSVFDWDLNNGTVRRKFEGSGGQISAIELRPASGAPFPHDAGDEPAKSETMWGSTSFRGNGAGGGGDAKFHGAGGSGGVNGVNGSGAGVNGVGADGNGGFGGDDGAFGPSSPAHESLFGSPAGSLFGEDTMDAMGGSGNVFGDDDHSMDMDLHGGDVAMGEAGAGAGAPAGDGQAAAAPVGNGHDEASQATTASAAPAVNGTTADAASSTMASSSTAEPSSQPDSSSQQRPPSSSAPVAAPASAPEPAAESEQPPKPPSPAALVVNTTTPTHVDPTQASDSVFMAAAVDGTIRVWDRRVPDPVARLTARPGVPPWCMGACWSPDGNWIYAGRRNGTVEEFNIHKARGGWLPERTLKLPAGSGAVSCVRPMVNGRHLVCASHDILRLYDLRDSSAFKGSSVPFLIIPGPPRAGVISQLYIDPSSRFMVSTAGTRGWEGSCTETFVGYEINPVTSN